MAARRYTLISFDDDEMVWELHKPGCGMIREAASLPGARRRLAKADLEWDDDQLLEALDPQERLSEIEEIALCECTGYGPPPEEPTAPEPDEPDDEEDDEEDDLPAPSSAAARASQAAARAKLLKLVEETVDKLVVERGIDNVGEGDQWAEERLSTCGDYVYDLAVEVRKLRERGDSWWRVAYELHLPGSGASNKQGRKGSAFARRLWRAAWGKTYLGERGQRESKLTREARALENLGRPYFSEADEDSRVADVVRGKMLHWVTRLEGKHGLITSAQEAYVHDDPKFIRVKEGPLGRYLEFYEQIDPAMLLADPRMSIAKSGPLRAVYVDRITRVGV